MKQTKQIKRNPETKIQRGKSPPQNRSRAEAEVERIRGLIGSLTGRQQTLADAIASNKQEAAAALLNGDAEASAELGAARRRMISDADALTDALMQARAHLADAERALADAERTERLDDYAATKTLRLAGVQKVEHTGRAFAEALRELTALNDRLWSLRNRLVPADPNAVFGTPLSLDQQSWRVAAFGAGNEIDGWFRHKIGSEDRAVSLMTLETQVHAEIDAQLGLGR